jgi:DNA ligase (NAD+)
MSTSTGPRERIEELAARIDELRDAYYRAEPLVADAEYDALEDELRALIDEHPDLTPDPNPLEQVGATAELHAPVRHSRPMLSLEKATKPEQVAAFFERFPGQPVVVMPKLDGFSLALVYENGRLARAVTRGDGTTGDDVTPLVRALSDGVPDRIDAAGRTEVRGEMVMLRSTFAAYNQAHPDKPLINPRNAAAGTVRAKDPEQVKERRLRFFAFDLDTEAGTHADLEDALTTLGFEAADMRHTDDAAAAQRVIGEIEAQRNELDYDLDGAVLRLADRNAYAAAGTRSNSPRGALAFKYAAEEKTTVLADVVWDVGKIGKVAPVAVLEPVFVGGTTVTRATLANQEVIRARDVRIGDTVLVRRAGDVIPFVAGVLDASKRTGEEREIVPPDTCPSCGQPLTEEGNSRELYCTNVTCPAQTVRRLIHWASRAAADIDAIGPKWIERLNEAGLLDRPSDFYALDRETLLGFERIADVSADRMIHSIEASKGVGLRRALVGLAIPMASEGTAAKLCRAGFTSLEEIADAGEERLQQVEDVGPKVAASLSQHLNRDTTRKELERLRHFGVDLDVHAEDLPPKVSTDAPLAGKTVVITGAIADPRTGEKVPRPAFQRLCERAGASAASSVSASTDMLITGDNVGASKTAKAEKLGVAVVDQGDVWRLLIDAGVD